MDQDKFRFLIERLYSTVRDLETMFPGRHFTPDGHMVGSIGECLVANAYNLELMPASNKGFDAISKSGLQVEIKATQSDNFAFRSESEHIIAIKILPDGSFEEIYNGPGDIVWRQFEGKALPSNGQFNISLSKLKKLNDEILDSQKIPKQF